MFGVRCPIQLMWHVCSYRGSNWEEAFGQKETKIGVKLISPQKAQKILPKVSNWFHAKQNCSIEHRVWIIQKKTAHQYYNNRIILFLFEVKIVFQQTRVTSSVNSLRALYANEDQGILQQWYGTLPLKLQKKIQSVTVSWSQPCVLGWESKIVNKKWIVQCT